MYSAGTGYDLCTGLGTPKANILVSDLVGSTTQTATHFTVTTRTSSTAGSTISVTVYRAWTPRTTRPRLSRHGPLHQQRQSGRAALELHRSWRSDNGVHTFTAIVLKTAGSQSVTATDTSTSSNTGQTRQSQSTRRLHRNSPSASSRATSWRVVPSLRR